MGKYTADFETTVDENDCRVWAYAICEIGKPDNFIYGNNIGDFMSWCARRDSNDVVYFHNLKFDGEYIIHYLLMNGYTFIKDKKDRADMTFTTLITDMGQFYSIEVYFEVKNTRKINKVKFLDSLKILNFSVENIAKDFDLPIKKLQLDYKEKREVGHVLTEHEIDYIRNDVEIMSRALDIMFNEGLNKMTISSDALSDYKSMCPNFKKLFPVLPSEIDKDIRSSYKGGFTYLNPKYKEKTTGAGIVFDVNSMYPARMVYDILPYGEPIFFEGQYEKDPLYPLYVQQLTCVFDLKKGKVPSIQIKHNSLFVPNEYVASSDGCEVTLTLTSVDLELFFENYDIIGKIEWGGGWKFKAMSGLFTDYINKWTEKKIEAKKAGNSALYRISKLMLNSTYGRFGLNGNGRKKYPFIDSDGSVKYIIGDNEERPTVYIPIATFITSYARAYIIRSWEKMSEYSLTKYGFDAVVYADTDSLHVLLSPEDVPELAKILEIDDYKLGAWKLESTFKKGKYLRQKCYIEQNDEDKINVTVAGLPKRLSKYINFKNFKIGFTTEGMKIDEPKLTYKHVKGGVLLVDTDFSIK